MRSLKKYPPYASILPVLDGLTIMACLIFAIILRGRSFAGEFTFIGEPLDGEKIFLFFFAACSTFIFHYFNLYKINVIVSVADQTIRIVKALSFVVLAIAILSFFTRASFIVDSRLAILYFTASSFSMMLVGRVVIFRTVLLFLTRTRLFKRSVLVVGAGTSGRNLVANIDVHDYLGLSVVGFLDDQLSPGTVVYDGAKVIGSVSELRQIVEIFDVDEILICLENVSQARLFEVMEESIKTERSVKISSPLYDVVPSRLDMEKYGEVAVVAVSRFGPSPVFIAYKRIFDAVFAVFGLLLLLPVFAAIALAVKITSRGPVFFRQVRIGKDGTPFDFYKFRSMTVGSDSDPNREKKYAELIRGEYKAKDDSSAPLKIIDDSRVTKVGRFLRLTSLDELPQLFNVLKGDMSLVGPRPCLPYEWKHYEDWHKKRLSVTPGCTGMWQVVGRSKVSFQDMVILDLFYSQSVSFHLDLWLLLKTIPVMVFGRGAR
ncbi:MAG: sugar transferase [Bacteroidota bacterium]